jgi:hypothetical protein
MYGKKPVTVGHFLQRWFQTAQMPPSSHSSSQITEYHVFGVLVTVTFCFCFEGLLVGVLGARCVFDEPKSFGGRG